MKTLFHITQLQEWENAKSIGTYRADSLKTEGFIHCSTSSQVLKTANRFFKHQTRLVILYINSDKLQAEVRYEAADNDLFPHLYGELNIDAVYKTANIEPNDEGLFDFSV
jgi:uncharacterized protein (DUF952 family)